MRSAIGNARAQQTPALISDAAALRQAGGMEDLPHATPAEVAERLRSLGEGLTNPVDVAAVNTYADELEREARAPLFKFRKEAGDTN
jgi:hypothetical protein